MSSEVDGHRGRLIAERRYEVGFGSRGAMCDASTQLAGEDPNRCKAFSASSLKAWEHDETGERLARANNKTLRTLAYLLGWVGEDFHMRLGVSIGSVPRLEETRDQRIFTFIERFGVKYKPTIRLPVFGSVAAGIIGYTVDDPAPGEADTLTFSGSLLGNAVSGVALFGDQNQLLKVDFLVPTGGEEGAVLEPYRDGGNLHSDQECPVRTVRPALTRRVNGDRPGSRRRSAATSAASLCRSRGTRTSWLPMSRRGGRSFLPKGK